jgi:predicted MFS family arabinose efflux permease
VSAVRAATAESAGGEGPPAAEARPGGGARPLVIATAGIGMVGTSFGMARYGYGLLLPDIRASYGLTGGQLGLIGASSYVAYLVASVAAAVAAKLGARGLIAAGGACAAGGMLLAGLSRSPAMLVAGLLIAGASAGLVYPPFSDVTASGVDPHRRSRVLATISSGTGWGVAIAAPVAIALGAHWRTAWLVFAAAAVLATGWALAVLPRSRPARATLPALKASWFVCPRSGPLLAGALLIGLASSVYWTFAVDLLVGSGSLSSSQSRLFLGVVGVASVAGMIGGDASRRIGAGATFAAAVIGEGAALALLALGPGSLVIAALSAALFGIGYNVAVSIETLWSARVFASRPSAGLASVMFMSAAGLLIGPPIAGFLADAAGMRPVFLAGALLLVSTLALTPRRGAVEA